MLGDTTLTLTLTLTSSESEQKYQQLVGGAQRSGSSSEERGLWVPIETAWTRTSSGSLSFTGNACLMLSTLQQCSHRPFDPLRYFNEMSAQGLRARTVSSPIPYTPSPSSSRPISPGRYLPVCSSSPLNSPLQEVQVQEVMSQQF